MKRCLAIGALFGLLMMPLSHAKSPGLAGALSIIPGLGQAYNGKALEGVGWFGTVAGLYILGGRNMIAAQAAFDLWLYNMYDAYRDAGAKNTTKHNVFVNYISAFNPLNIWDPFTPIILAGPALSPDPRNSILGPAELWQKPFFFAFIGLGEEGLFRGFLYPAFSDLLWDSKIAGAVVSSAAFSAYHLINGTAWDRSAFGLGIRFALGLVWCAQLTFNKYDMRKGIFSHTWGDFIIDIRGGGEASRLQNGVAAPKMPPIHIGYSIPLP